MSHAAINAYIKNVNSTHRHGDATEHSYRGMLQTLIEQMFSGISATNEPKQQQCGAPDYVLRRGSIPVGYIEVKDVGSNLQEIEKSDQLTRYRGSLGNLILSDYLTFRYYTDGTYRHEITLATLQNGMVVANPKSDFDAFATMLHSFCAFQGPTIDSSVALVKIMAPKTRLMKEVLLQAVEQEDEDGELRAQMNALKKHLVHDLDSRSFADMYAQTIAYGLFAARLHDNSTADFSRHRAQELLPKSNPFLKKLFSYISGVELDERIVWIIDDLCSALHATDTSALTNEYTYTGSSIDAPDPFLHFYETFLTAYDPTLRKKSGVYYTPEPVVKFMVKAVDDILRTDFNLPQGLADTATVPHNNDAPHHNTMARVQILDPAAGTGAFMAEIVRVIADKMEGQQGAWPQFVQQHLLPRLHGFEMLMAPYAICHLKLEMTLRQCGHTPPDGGAEERFGIYLTNTLEKAREEGQEIFAKWLVDEARAADAIKTDTPVMVVVGNPPYSAESQNKSAFIQELLQVYKKEPGGTVPLNERNPKWINDDYVKFIRFGQDAIDRNGSGILAYINNHSFLDNTTFRGMRWHLLQSFDHIYIIDLHGNSKKKEIPPDGSKDENVFNIQQGVSINIFVKNGHKESGALAQVHHYDLYGTRTHKYHFLSHNTLSSIPFVSLPRRAPMYFMVQKDFVREAEYAQGFSLANMLPLHSAGIVTARDGLTIQHSKQELRNIIHDFASMDPEEARTRYNLGGDTKEWKVALAQQDLRDSKLHAANMVAINYRPFDSRVTYYTGISRGFHCRPRQQVMHHLLAGENVGLVACRQAKSSSSFAHVWVATELIEGCYISNRGCEINYLLPLYLYPHTNELDNITETTRTPNLNSDIVADIAARIALPFVAEKEQGKNSFAPIDILDYVYGALHSPRYRQKYTEFLKIDFPRVPYPTNAAHFWRLAGYGAQLRAIHLLEPHAIDAIRQQCNLKFPVSGDGVVRKPAFQQGRVFINADQYFSGVSEQVWNFYIGGYQPAQKWLKERKGRTLTYDDIAHYQNIIAALHATADIMHNIDTA